MTLVGSSLRSLASAKLPQQNSETLERLSDPEGRLRDEQASGFIPQPAEIAMIRRFLSTIFPLVVICLHASADAASGQGFEAEYESLVADFSSSLSNEAAVEALVEQADELYDRIRQHRRESRDSLSDEERDGLSNLSDEVRAFQGVTRVVGQLSNAADVSVESFDAVRERLGLEPQVLHTHESGVELVRIEVDSFVSLLLHNPTATTFSVMYGVNDPERPGGVGSAFCENYSVMSGLFNSRDRDDLDGLEFTLETRASRAGRCD